MDSTLGDIPQQDLKRPAEFFGIPFEEDEIIARVRQGAQEFECPFLHSTCIKKQHNVPIGGRVQSGVCSVWYDNIPHITCAKRHLENDIIFRESAQVIFGSTEVFWISEVGIGEYGRLDFLITKLSRDTERGVSIEDWFALETVSIDTTSTRKLNNAVDDRISGSVQTHYNFGLNFEHTLKLMIAQVALKGAVLENWGKKYVWVVQDVFWNYVERLTQVDTSEGVNGGSIIILVVALRLNPNNNRYVLCPSQIKSTTVSRFKTSITPRNLPNLEAFMQRVRRKIRENHGL